MEPAAAPAPSTPGRLERFEKALGTVLLIGITVCLVITALFSLRWEVFWDQVAYLYQAFLYNERGFRLYVDIMDVNMPGAAGFMILFSKLIGYSDVAWRCLDIVWLSAILGTFWIFLRPFGARAAWVASAAFAWLYLMQPESQHLQRDYVMILPLGAACALALSPTALARRPYLRTYALGLLFGLAALMKPQAALALPWFALAQPDGEPLAGAGASWKATARVVFLRWVLAGLGGLTVAGLAALWLWHMGSLENFLVIVRYYWPIYARQHFDNGMLTIDASERFAYIVDGALHLENMLGRQVLLVPGLCAAVLAVRNPALTPRQRATIRLLRAAVLLHFLEVVIVGHFHPYAYFPTYFFAAALGGIAVGHAQVFPPARWVRLATVLFALCLVYGATRVPATPLYKQLAGEEPKTPWTDRADDIEAVIHNYRRPGDKIQALDWLGGSERVMLDLRMTMATPYQYDTCFYHAVQEPLVQRLRQDFLERMYREPPRFILHFYGNRMTAFDPHDDRSFRDAVKTFLNTHYHSVWRGPGYHVLLRNGP